MEDKIVNNQISYCGLYCGNCRRLISGKCSGCSSNNKLSWCKIRTCNIDKGYVSCAQCIDPGYENCKKVNNFIGKFFSIVFNSDRIKGLAMIEYQGHEAFISYMKTSGKMAISRKSKDDK